ncbi:MAG: glycoside hydrolase family 28 protein, partial [Duncaniella sp.]|nr:glycoside hydrolase family 28 protein [Duncaniella sp.]
MIINKTLVCAAAVALAAPFATLNAADNPYDAYYKGMPVEMPRVSAPEIPAYEVTVTDFGAIGDGLTLNTEAFAKAMAHLASKGGGKLNVPEGIWYTGPITFESNVELHLANGALVLFSENLADYPVVKSDWEGLSTHRCLSPLNARGKHDIAITGNGTFNGNGQKWRPVKKGKMTADQWKKLTAAGAVNSKGDVWFPNERIREVYENREMQAAVHSGDKATVEYAHDFLRPVLLSFIGCKNVMLKDATFENSPAWNIHPLLCDNLIVDNINVRNPWYAQNGDGIDIESCNT